VAQGSQGGKGLDLFVPGVKKNCLDIPHDPWNFLGLQTIRIPPGDSFSPYARGITNFMSFVEPERHFLAILG